MSDSQENYFPVIKKAQSGLPATEYRQTLPPPAKEEIYLKDYLEIIVRKKWLVAGILFFTFISTLIFSLAAEKQYEAQGSIEVNQRAQKITKFEDVVTEKLRFEEFVATQTSLLKSDTLASLVIDKLNLAEHPVIISEKEDGSEDGLFDRLKLSIKNIVKTRGTDQQDVNAGISLSEAMTQKKLLDFFKKRLTVTPQRDSMIINISFSSPDRGLSMNAVNALMDEFINWKMNQQVESSIIAREFLIKQINQAKIHLEEAEEKQNRFAKQAGFVSMDSKINSVYRQLEDINTALGEAEANLSKKETNYQQALKDGPSNLPQVLNSPLINGLKADYARLRSEYENLTDVFYAEYPDVKAIKSRMDSIENQINNESQKIFNSIKHEYETARNLVKSLNEKLENKKLQAIDLNERATQFKIMEREVETNKEIYQSLLERAKEIESMAGVSTNSIQIIDRASLPIFPSKPNVKLNLFLAIVLGLLAGIGGALLVEYFADTVTNVDQITEDFQPPLLGVIPLGKESAAYPLGLVFTHNPRTGISEALLTLKVSIQLSISNAKTKCIAITSTSPGEGKTTIAANLAQAFAGAGEKVVIIDADLRKPTMQKIFATSSPKKNGNGLSSYLTNLNTDNLIEETDLNNIYLIQSGPVPSNPVELLASSKFKELINSLSGDFDRILIDAPPHQGFADVLVLSKQVGGIILVCSIGECTRDGLRHFKKSMANVNGNVLGFIINKSPRPGYGYKYYQYGHHETNDRDESINV